VSSRKWRISQKGSIILNLGTNDKNGNPMALIFARVVSRTEKKPLILIKLSTLKYDQEQKKFVRSFAQGCTFLELEDAKALAQHLTDIAR